METLAMRVFHLTLFAYNKIMIGLYYGFQLYIESDYKTFVLLFSFLSNFQTKFYRFLPV